LMGPLNAALDQANLGTAMRPTPFTQECSGSTKAT
jgi:hypothetical protein